ncbi:hypothetical protein JW865_03705 [Candidatus Bathyarchaeota archaeon]|nr:hypothetical protein [Candidatus Bathyarchaeota archaeon]
MIGTYVTGVLPRTQELIAKTRLYDRGRLSEEELETSFLEATKRVIGIQETANLTFVGDGMLKWQDLLRPFSEGLEGVEPGPLLRWFNNNTFYKAPIIKSDIKIQPSISNQQIDLLPSGKKWKATLPAPYTFSILSIDQHYQNKIKLMKKYAGVLNQEIKALEKKGFKYIQLNDPALVYITTAPEESKLKEIIEVYEIVTEGVKAKTCLHTFFGDASPLLKIVQTIPFNDIGVDLYETDTKIFNNLKLRDGLVLGVIDSRNSIIEDVQDLEKIIKEILLKIETNNLYITSNADMDFLTIDKAEEKIQVLSKLAGRLQGV